MALYPCGSRHVNCDLAPAPWAGTWRTDVQNSSVDYGCRAEKKILFDEKIGRIWSNATLSERAKYTREYVLRQRWQPYVDDRFDVDSVIQTKAEFSYATLL